MELGIGELTVWALSAENLSRPTDEVAALTRILSEKLAALAERVERSGTPVRIRVFGRLDALPRVLAETARRVQAETEGNDDTIWVNVALGYSGRDGARRRHARADPLADRSRGAAR